MAPQSNKKRSIGGKASRPFKKQKRQQQYNSDSGSASEGDGNEGFDPVNLLDSDDDIHNAAADDVASSEGDGSSSDSEGDETPAQGTDVDKAAPDAAESGDDDDDEGESDLDEYDLGSDSEDGKRKSKRNDPTAFATSISKILSTKLASSKRADPVLSRSAAAHEASKAAVDSALEAKAKKHLRDQKRRAQEKGRVRDVLVASRDDVTGDMETSTAEIQETERKLRKVAQRGVVKLFNAVRAAQVKATDAERAARADGVIGIDRREEKVNEMTKKGFLDLIASGGGGLKKGGLEEA